MDISMLAGYALLVIVLILIVGTIPALIIWDNIRSKRTAANLSTDIKPCSICALNSEQRGGLKLLQQKATGLAIATQYTTFNNYACPTHARQIHNNYQRHTILFGWWTRSGILRAPNVLTENIRNYRTYTRALSIATANNHAQQAPNNT